MEKHHHYYVYILKCSDGSYYTGVTNSLYKRIQNHIDGINPNCYTANRRPLELVYTEEFMYVQAAINRETQIKNWSRNKKEALIAGNWAKLQEFASSKGDSLDEKELPI